MHSKPSAEANCIVDFPFCKEVGGEGFASLP